MLGVTAFTEAPFADIGIVYSAAESEALTLLAEQTAIAHFLGTQTEGVAVADSQAATADFLGTQAESISVADSQTGIYVQFSDQEISITATDTQDATADFLSAQAESITITDSQVATADFLGAQAEGIALADTQDTTADFLGSQDEGITLADSQTGVFNYLSDQDETISLADTQDTTADFLGSQDEGITLADSQTGVFNYLSDQLESLTLTDMQDATAGFISTQEEAIILTDSQAATADFLSAQAENAALTDTQTGAVKYPVSGFDAIHLTDAQTDDYIYIRWVRTRQTIISQYANSPILLSLLSDWTEGIDPAVNIDAFYNLVWNVDTAVGYGLDVWGRIVNVSRILSLPGGRKFGYVVSSGAQDWDPLNQQQFYSGVTTTENFILADDAFRILILAKALANISNCAIPTYNRLLMQLFPNRGNVYVHDTGNMLFEIIFTFILQPFEIAIIEQSGVFVGPTGVGFTYQIILPQTLGFESAGSTAEPYNQGIFFTGH